MSTILAGEIAGPSPGRPARTATCPAAATTALPAILPRAPIPGGCLTAASVVSSATQLVGLAPAIARGRATGESLRLWPELRLYIGRAAGVPVHWRRG